MSIKEATAKLRKRYNMSVRRVVADPEDFEALTMTHRESVGTET